MKSKEMLKGIIAITMIAPVLTGCGKTLNVKDDMKVEFGTPISMNVADYLNNEKTDKDELTKILAETKLEIIGDKKVENKDYQQVGDYKVKLTYDDEEVEINVSVKDTTKPVFKDFKNSVDTYKDVKVDFTKLYKAEDLDKVTITADDSKVDYTKEGSYKATVTATDESNNAETKEVTVNVKKPEIKLDKTSKSVYVKESFVLKSTIKGKDTKATFKSSNSSVATVTETGKVTAKKKGTATITATANGIEAKCKVTVKEVPKGSSTTTKVVTNPTTGKKEEVVVVNPNPPFNQGELTGPDTAQSATLSKATLNKINSERSKVGIPALQWSTSLEEGAKLRAKEANEKFSHVRPNGTKWSTAFSDSCSGRAEIMTKSSSPVSAWMNSAPHKSAMLDPDYTHAAVAKCGKTYVCILWAY